MKLFRFIIPIAVFLIPTLAEAQFYVTGDDPGKLRWYSINTDNYTIIYPEGTDSLARVYGKNLEKFRVPVSRTVGYLPGGPGKLRMPVVMHAHNAANGSVAWAPKRMDFFTIPSAYDPEPMPWATMLSVHESRHVSQMQFGMTKAQKPIGWIFGEMWNILASLLYPGLSNIEGDAVIAETALTNSGRGRTADFLNYYRVAFDNGDFRRWDQWRLGSQRRYAPDHYALGYLTIGGLRTLYDAPQYMDSAYHIAARRPYNLATFYTAAKKMTGKKYEEVFMESCHAMHEIWKAEADARAPFIPSEQVTKEPRLYTDYQGLAICGTDLYAVKKGHETVPVLVRIDTDGNEYVLSAFSPQTSNLAIVPQTGKIYWSETLVDERWTLETDSRIRYMNISVGGKKNLTDTDMLLFNPGFGDGAEKTATVQYYPDGRSSLTVIDSATGDVLSDTEAPSGLQLVQTAGIGEDIYATAINDNGYGIYRLRDGEWDTVLEPQPVMVKNFGTIGDELMFVCDRTGADELYHFNPVSGELSQKTVTRYGADDFVYSEDGKWLYYTSQTMKGKHVFRTSVSDLIDRPADFTQRHSWHLAERLTEQEKTIAQKAGYNETVTEVETTFSEPERYGKFAHAFNLHSWAPVYVNVNNIMNMSFDHIWQAASLGATGIMQNRLATCVGEFGYSAHKDPYNPSKWRHSGHARLTYSGWYPVFELSVNFNDRAARQWSPILYEEEEGTYISLGSKQMSDPYIEGSIKAYIPFNFSSGGWYKGVIPQVSYNISNDKFNTSATVLKPDNIHDIFINEESTAIITSKRYGFSGVTEGKNTFRHSLTGSLRAYTMLATPNSAIYPRWGIGMEVGAHGGLESSRYLSPMGYAYLYGYVPGILRTHGIKLTATLQGKLNDAPFGQTITNILPRGLSENGSLLSWISVRNKSMAKVTADYAFPIFIGDLAIGGNFFSIKRLVVNPHFDYTYAGGKGLFSVGGELILDLHSILTLEWPCSFGITYSYNGGNGIKTLSEESGIAINRHFVGPTFNVSF